MTQIASLLAVATVFIGLWTLNIYISLELISETKLPTQELELKMQGSLCVGGGGRNCRILQYYLW